MGRQQEPWRSPLAPFRSLDIGIPQRHWAWGLMVPLVFWGVTAWIMPIGDTLQFDPDEGIELAKVMLYNQGYTLYDQIWNDQPPLLTLCLGTWLKIFGSHIVAARLLTLSFAAVLVGAFYGSLALSLGMLPALLGTTGLCLTLNFLRLSVSVMRGLPAIALTMLAVYLLLLATARQSRKWVWPLLILSGVCFGLSLQVKLFTLLIAPALVLHIWGEGQSGEGHRPGRFWRVGRPQLYGVLGWGLAVGLTFVAIGWATHSLNLDQLLGAHFDGAAQEALQREPSWLVLLMFCAQDLDFFLLAGVGTWALLKEQPTWPKLPLVWLLSVLLGLSSYQPLWYHYYPLLSIPITWLATVGLTRSLPFFQQPYWWRQIRWRPFRGQWRRPTLSRLTVGLVLFACVLTPIKLAVLGIQNHLFVAESQRHLPLIEQVSAHRATTQWLLTDVPILAFYTQINVPPELAVFSSKRLKSGNLDADALRRILRIYEPGQIVLGRYPELKTDLQPDLERRYSKAYEKDKMTQYLRRPLRSQKGL